MKTEQCFVCYGDGNECYYCYGTGIITHGPYHKCQFCKRDICGCKTCQAYCTCPGYYGYFIVPYEEESARA